MAVQVNLKLCKTYILVKSIGLDMSDMPSLTEIQKKLNAITAEMMGLIQKYNLETAVNSPFDMIEAVRGRITDQQDYIRFLELSVEGRVYGEAGDALMKADERAAEGE